MNQRVRTGKKIVLERLYPNPMTNRRITFGSELDAQNYLNLTRGYIYTHIKSSKWLVSAAKGGDFLIVEFKGRKVKGIDLLREAYYSNNAGHDWGVAYRTKKLQEEAVSPRHVTPNQINKRVKKREQIASVLIELNQKYGSLVTAAKQKDPNFIKLQKLIGSRRDA